MTNPHSMVSSRRAGRATLLLSVLLAAAVAGIALAAKPESPSRLETTLSLLVEGQIVVGTDGAVEEVVFDTAVDGSIRPQLESRIRGWRFQPVVVDGQVRRARSAIRVTLAATRREGEDGYTVRIDNAIFPGERDDKPAAKENRGFVVDMPTARITVVSMAPPIYPRGMQMMNVSGKVLLGLRIGLDGRVESVEPIQSMLMDVRGRDRALEAAIRQFELAAITKARTWRFVVSPKAGEPAVRDLTHTVPVVFLMEGAVDGVPGKWQTLIRTPKQEVSWLPRISGVNTPGVADVRAGESMPVASRLVLAQDVVGAAL